MEPILSRDGVTIFNGDCREILPHLEAGSVNCCVTSPPYWGLRDYGHESQIGLEGTPDQFVSQMVAVFREVRRVLRDDGTLWLNLGDSYNAYNGNAGPVSGFSSGAACDTERPHLESGHGLRTKGLKPKDLVGIPWRVAFALQEDGWFLRQDVIWHKPAPMPESVKDRCTKAHEYIFLLSKSPRYHFDHEAIAEPCSTENQPGNETHKHATRYDDGDEKHRTKAGLVKYAKRRRSAVRGEFNETRNKRSVWTVNTKPYPGAHFAVYPPELIEPCILAGCPEGGTVLDPFLGSGTTAAVAQQLGRRAVGCELNADYVKLALKRFRQRTLLPLE